MSTRRPILVLVGLAMNLALVTATSPAGAQEVPAGPYTDDSVFIVTTGDETEGDAMRALANSDSPDAARAAEILQEWAAHSDGEPASVTSEEPETVSATEPEHTVAAAAWQWGDPNTWPVRGSRSTDQWYWTNLKPMVEGKFCSTSTCTITDRLSVTNTVDPGTTTSRITTKSLYSPNAGNFTTRNWSFIAICSGAICGSETKQSTASTITTYVTTNSSRQGKRLTLAVGISQSTIAQTVRDTGKTADCLGQTGTDKRCKYIYN